MILVATSPRKCELTVSYKKWGKRKEETFAFRSKNVRLETMFGALESGKYTISSMIQQNRIAIFISDYVLNTISFSVLSYRWTYLSEAKPTVYSDTEVGSKISSDLKQLILKSRNGDKIIISEINALGLGGISSRFLEPIELKVVSDKLNMSPVDFYTYKKSGDSITTFHLYADTIFNAKHYQFNLPVILSACYSY